MRQSNPFGFNSKKSSFLQLLKILGIPDSSKQSIDLKDAFIMLGKMHFEIALAAGVQTGALEKIRVKLEKGFPDLFDKDDKERKLYFALHAIKAIHNRKRTKTKHRKRTTTDYDRDGPSFVDLSDMKSDDSEEIIIVSTNKSRAARSQLKAKTVSASLQHAIIQKFLEACEPAMDRFLKAFVDFGCTTDQYLLSIAMFSPEKRNMVLRRLLSTHSGEDGATEMEIAILDDHFVAYFS